jgi:hypothetical protein
LQGACAGILPRIGQEIINSFSCSFASSWVIFLAILRIYERIFTPTQHTAAKCCNAFSGDSLSCTCLNHLSFLEILKKLRNFNRKSTTLPPRGFFALQRNPQERSALKKRLLRKWMGK